MKEVFKDLYIEKVKTYNTIMLLKQFELYVSDKDSFLVKDSPKNFYNQTKFDVVKNELKERYESGCIKLSDYIKQEIYK